MNQIFDIAIKKLNESGHQVKPAIESVFIEKQYSVKNLSYGSCICIYFESDAGLFTIETNVKPFQNQKSL